MACLGGLSFWACNWWCLLCLCSGIIKSELRYSGRLSSRACRRGETIDKSFMDQRFYDQVAAEIESRQLDKGVWVRAFSEASGDDTKAKAVYIALRVAQLEAEARAAQVAKQAEEAEAKAHAQEELRKKQRENRHWTQEPILWIIAVMLMFLLLAPVLFGQS
jgi:hypothetical protein